MSDFSWAMGEIKRGSRLCRKSWKSKNCYIASSAHCDNDIDDYEKFVLFRTEKKKLQPGWAPTQEDMFADDWKLFK